MQRDEHETIKPDHGASKQTTRATRVDRVFAVLAAGLMVAMAFVPTAAAETGEHTYCIGDSGFIDRLDNPGTGCARSTITTQHDCRQDSSTGWTCDVRATVLGVEVSGLQSCGSTGLAGADKNAAACTDIRDQEPYRTDEISDLVGTYSGIGATGRTVSIPVETCAWVNGANEGTVCSTWTHEHRLPPNPTQSSGLLEETLNNLGGVAEFAETTVENAEAPIGASA